jgi:UDP-2,3-diacylglucosamine hydrolase
MAGRAAVAKPAAGWSIRAVTTVAYIAGDVHLGVQPSAFPAWLDDLHRLPPARLVILGDLFEYWLETAGAERRHAVVLERLRGLRRRGWRIDLLRGNREVVAGRRLECSSGARLVFPALDLVVGGVRVRVVHGDRLCRDPGYHLMAAWLRSFWHRGWQALHPALVQELVARGIRRGSHARTRVARGAPLSFLDPRRVHAAARGADVLVAGHIHVAVAVRIAGVPLHLVGDWGPHGGRWIEVDAAGTLRARQR